MGAAARTPSALQPKDLAARHTPRRLAEAPPGLSRRVRLPPHPPPHTSRRLPNTARTRGRSRTHHLPPDHPPSAPKPSRGAERISMISTFRGEAPFHSYLPSTRPSGHVNRLCHGQVARM